MEGGKANAVAQTDDADETRVAQNGVGKLIEESATYDDAHMGKIASRPSRISNSSKRMENSREK